MPTPSRWLPFLAWPRPSASLLRGELLAGLAVALVMVPQCIAYATLAGMPPVTGLYAALLPALVAVLFGNSTRISVGPSALTCILIATSLMPLASPGSPQWIALAAWLALVSGLVQFALGAARVAWTLNLVSSPVLYGFTQAAALLIIASQLPVMLGAAGPLGALFASPRIDVAALSFGAGSLLLLVLGRHFFPRVPMVIIVVGGAAAVSVATGYSQGGAVIGELPAGLPSLAWPAFPGTDTIGALVVPALVIALVSYLETASSAKVEAQRDGRRRDDDQDLLAQGLAKLAAAVTGSFATSTSFSRSAIALYAGAKSAWSTVATIAFVLVALLVLTPVLRHVPTAVLAAVVIAAVSTLLKPRELPRLWRIGRAEAFTALVTFAITIASAPRIYWGVIAGVLMGLVHFLYHRLHPRIIEVGLHPDGSLRDRHLWKLPPLAPAMYALRMDDELDFASASSFERAIAEHLAEHPGVKHVCLFAQPINRVDATGAEAFAQLRSVLASQGVTLHISGIKLPVERVLRNAGALGESPLLRMYRTDAEALLAFTRLEAEAATAR